MLRSILVSVTRAASLGAASLALMIANDSYLEHSNFAMRFGTALALLSMILVVGMLGYVLRGDVWPRPIIAKGAMIIFFTVAASMFFNWLLGPLTADETIYESYFFLRRMIEYVEISVFSIGLVVLILENWKPSGIALHIAKIIFCLVIVSFALLSAHGMGPYGLEPPELRVPR